MRRLLDTAYLYSGGLAALSILAICLLVSAQVCLNILARLGGPDLSFTIPSYADFSGYLLASASFLALAHTLRHGTHIRVNLVISRLPECPRWVLECVTLAVATLTSFYATWFAALMTMESWQYGDKSTGIVAIPIWMPQSVMVAGLVLLSVAFLDTLIESLRAGRSVIVDHTVE